MYLRFDLTAVKDAIGFSEPNVTVKWLANLLHIREVPGSSLVLDTGYRD
jgi:hypothetical protein